MRLGIRTLSLLAALSGAWKHQTKEGQILELKAAARAFEFRG